MQAASPGYNKAHSTSGTSNDPVITDDSANRTAYRQTTTTAFYDMALLTSQACYVLCQLSASGDDRMTS